MIVFGFIFAAYVYFLLCCLRFAFCFNVNVSKKLCTDDDNEVWYVSRNFGGRSLYITLLKYLCF